MWCSARVRIDLAVDSQIIDDAIQKIRTLSIDGRLAEKTA
jgi:hypothetical protein